MSKKLNEDLLGSELKASAFFASARNPKVEDSPTPLKAEPTTTNVQAAPASPLVKVTKPKETPSATVDVKTIPVDQSMTQSIDRSIDSAVVDHSAVMGKPRGFYITEKQNQDLDVAVLEISKRLAGKLPFKVDRSVLIRLILESSDLTDEANIRKLSAKLVS